MSIIRAFEKAFDKKEKRGWDKIYVFVDIHETILYPTYEKGGEKKYYPYAKEALLELNDREDVSLGLYTCSYPEEILKYLEFFKSEGIDFEHVNKNSHEENNAYGYFKDKPYFNVIIEDKAGFEGEYDWCGIFYFIKSKK